MRLELPRLPLPLLVPAQASRTNGEDEQDRAPGSAERWACSGGAGRPASAATIGILVMARAGPRGGERRWPARPGPSPRRSPTTAARTAPMRWCALDSSARPVGEPDGQAEHRPGQRADDADRRSRWPGRRAGRCCRWRPARRACRGRAAGAGPAR